MTEHAALIGVVRNGGDGLRETLTALGALAPRISRAIIATNDNTDDTLDQLAGWTGAPVQVLNLYGLAASEPDRVRRISVARNACLDALAGDDTPPPVTIVADLDGPNGALRPEDVCAAIELVAGGAWTGVFANQPAGYYDLYALRHPIWCPGDIWAEYRAAPKGWFRKGRDRARQAIIYGRQYAIPRATPPIEVESAFGGLGIYDTNALLAARYAPTDAQGQAVCEHVTLHAQIRDHGGRLAILPWLENIAPSEHLGPGSGAPWPGEANLKGAG